MEEPAVRRRSHDLSHGRQSLAGGTYFVTFCTQDRATGLDASEIGSRVLKTLLDAVDEGRCHAAVVMPDHVHAVLTLGGRLTLSQTVARAKSMTRTVLLEQGLRWQRGFFDHRVREAESLESFVLYVFLNPYRAGLIGLGDRWPWSHLGRLIRFRFQDVIEEGHQVPAEWLGEVEAWAASMGSCIED